MRIVKLIQGSPQWHEHRKVHRCASQSPIVMGLSPFQTPYQLFLEKTCRSSPELTLPMIRGTELEPRAREAYEKLTGLVMEPLVVADGEYSASLDGLTLDQQVLLEIKCPYKGQTSDLWQTVEAGEIPEHYRIQIQHQLMLSGAHLAHLFVFDGRDGLLLEVTPQPADWPRIHEAWESFIKFVRDDTPPPLSERDTLVRSDPEWEAAGREFAELKKSADEAAEKLDAAKQRLLALATHARTEGGGVLLTRYLRQGSVDYEKVAQLTDIDLAQYRKPAREETRITVLK